MSDDTWSGRLPLLGWAFTWFSRDCAMHGAINIDTPWGVLCMMRTMGPWRWYAYLSPNSTPWAATWAIGPGIGREDKRRATVLRALWGHNYDCQRLDPQILDRALWVVESRNESAMQQLGTMMRERAGWLREGADA